MYYFHVPVKEILVITGRGPDRVCLKTNLEDPITPDEKLNLEIKVPCGKGRVFTKTVFKGVKVETLNIEPQTKSFSES